MTYGVRLEVWGTYAAFNRPEMKVERVSYDVMTPSAARGVLEAIYWKPQMRWCIDRIRVLRPIRFTHVRRNELDAKIPENGRGTSGIVVEDHRQQRAARILRDVRYLIEAHVEVLDSTDARGKALSRPEGKHLDMFKRRAARGACFHRPYLGCREFPAHFRLLGEAEAAPPCPDELQGERDLGFMLWDIEYVPDPKGPVIEAHRRRKLRAVPRFFHAVMRDGVIDVPPRAETRR